MIQKKKTGYVTSNKIENLNRLNFIKQECFSAKQKIKIIKQNKQDSESIYINIKPWVRSISKRFSETICRNYRDNGK